MVLGSVPLNVSFRRSLVANNLIAWQQIVTRLMSIQLSNTRDTLRWSLNQNVVFKVRSMDWVKPNANVPLCHHDVWKLKLPLKIKVFMWYMIKG